MLALQEGGGGLTSQKAYNYRQILLYIYNYTYEYADDLVFQQMFEDHFYKLACLFYKIYDRQDFVKDK